MFRIEKTTRLMIAAITAFLQFSAFVAFAQENARPVCVNDDISTCQKIAKSYGNGDSPFPQDLQQMERYLDRSLEISANNCRNGSIEHCEALVATHRFGKSFEVFEEKYQLLGYLSLAALQTEEQCFSGSWDACPIAHVANNKMKKTKDINANSRATSQLRALFDQGQKLAKDAKPIYASCQTGVKSSCEQAYHRFRTFTKDDNALTLLGAATEFCGSGDQNWCSRFMLLPPIIKVSEQSRNQGKRISDLCETDIPEACFRAAFFAKDQFESDLFFEKACEGGLSQACMTLYEKAYRDYVKTKDPETLLSASDVMARSCGDLNDEYACLFLKYLSRQ